MLRHTIASSAHRRTSSPSTLTVIIGLSCLLTALVKADGRHLYGHYTNDFVVEMSSGVDELAELVAEAHGFTVDTRVSYIIPYIYIVYEYVCMYIVHVQLQLYMGNLAF